MIELKKLIKNIKLIKYLRENDIPENQGVDVMAIIYQFEREQKLKELGI